MKYLISRNVSNADEKRQGWSNSGRNMHCLSSSGSRGGGGTPIWNRRGCSSEILNLTPKGDHLGVA